MNPDRFTQEAGLRICGNLIIEKALFALLEYLSDFIPADRLFLQRFDRTYNAMRTIAHAARELAEEVDLLTPLSDEARDLVVSFSGPGHTLPYIMCPPQDNAIAREMLTFHRVKAESLMVLMIESQGPPIGSLVVLSENSGIHTEQHAELLAQLKEPCVVALTNALQHREVARLKDLLADDNRYLQNELQHFSGEEIIGADFGLKEVIGMVRQVAHLDSPVLLLGETGSGKEVIANAIRNSSSRRNGPFIKVNCGAIPESLMDSELFGHEEGAFTGALARKRGRFERAHGGTIFLDEVGELSAEAQIRLLRVLQEKEIERIGGSDPIKVDIRIIAATHRNLPAMVEEGKFREDLYFRLKVFPIRIPPLRDRAGDIPALVQHMILKKSREMKLGHVPALSEGAMDRLMAYSWPGNVRELENAVERALILNPIAPLDFNELQEGKALPGPPLSNSPAESHLELSVVVSQHIRKVLEMSGGQVEGKGGAAEILGMKPATLRYRMRKLNIPFGRKAKKT